MLQFSAVLMVGAEISKSFDLFNLLKKKLRVKFNALGVILLNEPQWGSFFLNS